MTDNEIIKALECCEEADTTDECKFMKCPNWKHNGCKYVTDNEEYQYAPMMAINKGICKDALDLINRQKAEIERLERHTKMHDEIKAEAVKEFAESLKEIDLYQFIEEYYENAELRYEVRRDWVDTHIDNLVKEMVGDKE